MKRGRNQRRRQGVNPNRALDSNGPDVRIRGTANQIHDKYLTLARDAASSGDRVKAESYLQHAEHYFRLIRSIQAVQTPAAQPSSAPPADGEQPRVEDGAEETAEARPPRRRRNNSDEQQPEPAEEKTREPADAESKTDGAGDDEGEERKPRRRRAPRRSAKKDDTPADETPAAAE